MADPETQRRMKGVGRVAFLKHRADIEAELSDGWPLKAIYEKRQDKLGFSYQHFVRYVNAIIRGAPAQPTPPKPAPAHPRLTPASLAQEDRHARYQPDRHAGDDVFHDPVERPDDRKRLLGED